MKKCILFSMQVILSTVLVLILFYGISYAFQDMRYATTDSLTVINGQSHSPDSIVVSYVELLDLPGETDGGVTLRIYNDKYVSIHYPSYMQRAGKYGAYLDQDTMDQLWVLLTNQAILNFDEGTVQQRISNEYQAQKESLSILSKVSDASSVIIKIFPNRYQSITYQNGDIDTFKKISWSGLKWDAKQFPNIEEIQLLAEIQRVLQAIMTRSDLKKIE